MYSVPRLPISLTERFLQAPKISKNPTKCEFPDVIRKGGSWAYYLCFALLFQLICRFNRPSIRIVINPWGSYLGSQRPFYGNGRSTTCYRVIPSSRNYMSESESEAASFYPPPTVTNLRFGHWWLINVGRWAYLFQVHDGVGARTLNNARVKCCSRVFHGLTECAGQRTPQFDHLLVLFPVISDRVRTGLLWVPDLVCWREIALVHINVVDK